MESLPGHQREREDLGQNIGPVHNVEQSLCDTPILTQERDDAPVYDDENRTEEAAEDSVDESIASHSLKRPAAGELADRPFKRRQGIFNNEYLELLNREIEDAAQRICVDNLDQLPASQLGLTQWSTMEKSILFEAVGRLGRDNLPAISSRLGSKSEMEIHQFLKALQDAHNIRLQTTRRPAVEVSEYPAAVELSQQCCHALEEAADAISVRQERREQQREETKWEDLWDLTPTRARELEDTTVQRYDVPDNLAPALHLLNLTNLLKLSSQIFMNSSVPGNNWANIDDTPPSIWATTLEDFYSLAVSVTRRLVQTTLAFSMTRTRAKQDLDSRYTSVVRKEDVAAAIQALGMTANAQEFWQKSARRLRLDVYNEMDEDDVDDEFMSFEEVEEELSTDAAVAETESKFQEMLDVKDDQGAETEESNTTDGSDVELFGEEEAAIQREVDEVFRFSLPDFPDTRRTRQALHNRISTELEQEEHADQVDQYASYREELDMWDLLQKKPAVDMPKRTDPGPPLRSVMDVESMFPLGRQWRGNVQYVSEWETALDDKGST